MDKHSFPTFSEVLTVFLLDAEARHVTADTYDSYRHRLTPFVAWCEHHFAVMEEWLEKSPMAKVQMPKVEKKIPATLTEKMNRTADCRR
jgi:site-specific recombinase XerD